MKQTITRFVATLLVLLFVLSICACNGNPGITVSGNDVSRNNASGSLAPEDIVSLELTGDNGISKYILTGDYYTIPGFACGTVTMPTDDHYSLYWADDKGKLTDYFAITTTSSGSFEFGTNNAIPVDATRLIVCNASGAEVDSISIPESKRVTEESYFDFASVSDVHVNNTSDGAPSKWTVALNWFDELDLDRVIVSGDMTLDGTLAEFTTYYNSAIASTYPFSQIYESRGNHDSQQNANFLKYTSMDGNGTRDPKEVHAYDGSPWYYILEESEGKRGNLFVFLAQEISSTTSSPNQDNFSNEQLDWFESVLKQYAGTNNNIFVVFHAFFRSWGPGDRKEGSYDYSLILRDDYPGNIRYQSILTEYKEIITMSGHSHVNFESNYNFNDENGTAARMIHNSSVCQPKAYVGTGLDNSNHNTTTSTYGSQGYAVYVYPSCVIYNAASISDKTFYGAQCYIMDTYSENRADAVSIEITQAPDKTVYACGDRFNATGMKVSATFSDGTKQLVRGWNYDIHTQLTTANKEIIVNFGSCTTKLDITVGGKFDNSFEGDGSLEKPYLIANEADFIKLVENMRMSWVTDTNTGTGSYGIGLHFKQTANLNLANYPDYEGILANSTWMYGFGGIYDGDGHTINVELKRTKYEDDVSIFPYVSGLIMNVEFSGFIYARRAQPIRCLCNNGTIANCVSNMELDGTTCSGLAYECYGVVYRYYENTMLHANTNHVIANKTSSKYVNVYANAYNSSNVAHPTPSYVYGVTAPEQAIVGFNVAIEESVKARLAAYGANVSDSTLKNVYCIGANLCFINDEVPSGTNIALGGTAFDDRGTTQAANAFDGNDTTNWQYDKQNDEFSYIGVMWSSEKALTGAKIHWESGSRASENGYTIEYTSDGVSWQLAPNQRFVYGNEIDTVTFGPVNAIGVRISIYKTVSTKYATKLYEAEIYGE